MGIHYIIHDLHPTLQSDHLEGKDFSLHLQINKLAQQNITFTYSCSIVHITCLNPIDCSKFIRSWWCTAEKKICFKLNLLNKKDQQRTVQPHLYLNKPCGAYLKNYDPSIDNVVKVDGIFVGVSISCVASSVVLVPVDAQTQRFASTTAVSQWLRTQAQSLSVECILLVQAACASSFTPCRYIRTWHDAIIRCQGADEGAFIILLWLVVWRRQDHTWGAGGYGQSKKHI